MTAPTRPGPGDVRPGSQVVVLDDVRRRYGSVLALDGVSLEVGAGELVGLLGPNGAGKSTILQLVSGLRRPTSGRVEVFGGDPRSPASRTRLGMTPQETGLPPTLRVGEVVTFVARHFVDAEPTGALLERFGLAGLERRQTGGLSGGQKRRLAVALAFVGRPRLVLLDEPTTGLDVESRHALWAAVRDFHAGGGTVVLTSHYLEEIEALAERVVVVDHGRTLVDGPLDVVRARVGVRRLRYRVGGRTVEELTPDADARVRALVRDDVPFRDLEVAGASLEEAFLAVTDRAGATAAQPSAPSSMSEPEEVVV